ncbi:tRNA (N6-threonylcarbamoyladenosine(37)-N6)-methyltransferase TrmO [Luteolibacter sp. LG18]|uniref:tRNA (N6-threonylcarbamoyladenosine(37)-N6)-methyltransferase TrmO n=1 Tax=Luteolibacter sp. LG18 TaxID=2819286 RepID=UPI002B30D958|nr:tRNA (N6-threonylcarbamoyladenosine(37)-N6)-methyltransferase TrmO [Luteolibacter sp. LG18]
MEIVPIGTVRSCFGEKFAVPRQPGLCPSAWGELVFHEDFRDPSTVRGLEGFSHVWLVFGFHGTAGQGWTPTVRPPRLGGNKRVGVFASRSTFRPNGLGLSLVRLEAVEPSTDEGPILRLGGLDLIDGTPIYDIKPYLPYAEALPDAVGGFAAEAPPMLEVIVSAAASKAFERLPARAQAVLRECLAQDPRPAVQTAKEDRVFGAKLCGHDVQFRITGGSCEIVSLSRLK